MMAPSRELERYAVQSQINELETPLPEESSEALINKVRPVNEQASQSIMMTHNIP